MAHRWYWLAQGLLLVLAALCAWTAYERSDLFFPDKPAPSRPGAGVPHPDLGPRRAGVQMVEAAETRTVAVLARSSNAADTPALASLLELTLTQHPGVTLVDREQIEAVVREQQLAAVFRPEDGGNRVRLGRLLAADVLVLLRPDPADPAMLEFTVSETRLGLRLSRHRIPASSQRPEEAAAAAAELVAAALARLGQPIHEVLAVPPFASENLTREHDHLRHAYAGLIEQTLLADPGVVLVELAEAQAIARELAIGGQAGGIDRPMPLYVEGAFRHDAAGRVRVTIRAQRSSGSLLQRQGQDLSEPEVLAFCRSVAGEVLDHVAGRAAAPADPAAEARVLAQRARLLLRLGDTEQAVRSLAVASVLQPDAVGYRKLALSSMLGRLSQQRYDSPLVNTNAGRTVLAEEARVAWEQSANHVWYYLDHVLCQQGPEADELREQLRRTLGNFMSVLSAYRLVAPDGQDGIWPEVDRLEEQAWGTARRAAEYGTITNDDLEDLLSLVMRSGPQKPPTKPELIRRTVALIDLAARNDSPQLDVAWATRRAMGPLALAHGALHKVLEGLPRPGHHPLVARAIEWERMSLEESLARRAEPQEPPHAREAARTVRAVDLTIKAVDPATGRHRRVAPWGWIRAGAGVDALWTQDELFLMSELGKAEPVYYMSRSVEPRHPMHVGEGIGEVCFDGRYVWAPVVHERAELVLVEPATGRVRRFTSEDGLPPMDRGGTAAPLGPGRILLIGAFGVDQPLRTWAATISYEPGQPLGIDQWYEAKEAPDVYGFGSARRAFWPRRARVMARPGVDGGQWVAVERRRSPTLNGGGVMIFEPQNRHATFPKDLLSLPHALLSAAGDGESLYFVEEHMLLRLRPPIEELEILRPYRTDQHTFYLSALKAEGLFLIDPAGCLWFTPDPTAQPWRLDPAFSLLEHWGYRSSSGFTRMLFTAYHGLVVINEEGACVRLERSVFPQRPARPVPLPKVAVPVGDGLCMAYGGLWTWEEAQAFAAELGGELFAAGNVDELNIARNLQSAYRMKKPRAYWTAMEHLPPEARPHLVARAGERIALAPEQGWTDEPVESRHGLIVRWPRPETDDPLPADTPVVFTNAAGIGFVLIPAGEFVMGSPAEEPGRQGDETPHTVRIERPFLMSVTEVTRSQFRSATGGVWEMQGDGNRPALISGSQGMSLIQSLQKLDGRRYRLPTEAEWEYAARAGATTAYPGGDSVADLRRVGWFAEPGQPTPTQPYPVAQREPNAWGLYDMHGNVWEWCSTGYHAYGTLAPPAVFDFMIPHPPPVLRGGSWLSPPELCRAAYRRAGPMSHAAGVRLVLDLIPENNLPDLGPEPEPGGRK